MPETVEFSGKHSSRRPEELHNKCPGREPSFHAMRRPRERHSGPVGHSLPLDGLPRSYCAMYHRMLSFPGSRNKSCHSRPAATWEMLPRNKVRLSTKKSTPTSSMDRPGSVVRLLCSGERHIHSLLYSSGPTIVTGSTKTIGTLTNGT